MFDDTTTFVPSLVMSGKSCCCCFYFFSGGKCVKNKLLRLRPSSSEVASWDGVDGPSQLSRSTLGNHSCPWILLSIFTR